ncbi:hypothetical protein AOLI_G00166900 [Acnodon oligacanthus]
MDKALCLAVGTLMDRGLQMHSGRDGESTVRQREGETRETKRIGVMLYYRRTNSIYQVQCCSTKSHAEIPGVLLHFSAV